MKNLDSYGINHIQTFSIPEASRELPREEQKRVLSDILREWFNHQNSMNYFPAEELLTMDWSWIDTSNKTLPQRIDKILKEHGAILPKSFLGALGNHVRESIPVSTEYLFDFTKSYNWVAGAFDDNGSCLWEGRRKVKDAMERDPRFSAFRIFSLSNIYSGNNSFRTQRSAVKTIGGTRYYGVSRCWIFKEKVRVKVGSKIKLSDVYLCFNSYGEHPIRQLSAVLAAMLDANFKRIKISNMKKTQGGLYINGSGYIVGPQHIINNIEHFDIGFQNSYDHEVEAGQQRDRLRIRNSQSETGPFYIFPQKRYHKNWENFKKISKKKRNSQNRKQINDELIREVYYLNRTDAARIGNYNGGWPPNTGRQRAYWRLWGYRLQRDFFRILIKMIIKRGKNVSTNNEGQDSSESSPINSELQLW